MYSITVLEAKSEIKVLAGFFLLEAPRGNLFLGSPLTLVMPAIISAAGLVAPLLPLCWYLHMGFSVSRISSLLL